MVVPSVFFERSIILFVLFFFRLAYLPFTGLTLSIPPHIFSTVTPQKP